MKSVTHPLDEYNCLTFSYPGDNVQATRIPAPWKFISE